MTDKSKEHEPYEHELYELWLAERREDSPSVTIIDQIMSRVEMLEHHRRDIWWLLLVQRIEKSRSARWAVCSGALAIGGLPFLFLAHVSKFLIF